MAEQHPIRLNDERRDLWDRLQRATGENTVSGALDVAAKHYLNDLENKRMAIEDLDPETADVLSTPWVQLDVTVDRSVTAGDD